MARIAMADLFAGLVTAAKDAQRVLAERHLLHFGDYFDAVHAPSDTQPSNATSNPPGNGPSGAAGGPPATPAFKPKLLRFLVPHPSGNPQQHHEVAVPLATLVQTPELRIKTLDVEFEARLDAPPDALQDGPSPLAAHLMSELDRMATQQNMSGRVHLEMKGSLFSSSMPLAKIKVTLEVCEQNEAVARLTDHYMKSL